MPDLGRSTLYNLQALRALAAFMVVVHHMRGPLAPTSLPTWLFDAGAAGVDIFFVISGFVMTHSVMMRPQDPVDFVWNRILRVAPLYWMATLFIGACVMAAPGMFRTISATPLEILQSLFFIPYLSAKGDPYPVLYVGWTLNFEFLFYAVFALSMVVGGRHAARIVGLSTTILVMLVVAGLILTPSSTIGKTYTDPILLEFGFGMGLAVVYSRMKQVGSVGGFVALVFAALLLGYYFISWPQVPRVIGAGIPATLIVLGSIIVERNGVVLRNRFVQLLGASSYALYLIHAVPLGAASRLTASMTGVAAAATVTLLTIAIVLVSCLVHLLVEKPVTRYLRRRRGRSEASEAIFVS